MSNGVQFEEDNFKFSSSQAPKPSSNISLGYGRPSYDVPEAKGMTGWLVRHGLASGGNTAQVILIGIVVINIIITYVVIRYFL
jgi:hypothetical protein